MDLGDPDVVETSDAEELEGSTQSFKDYWNYLRRNANESEIPFSPRKRMKVSDLQSLRFRHLFSPPSCYMTVFFPMLRMPPSLRAPFIRHYEALPHLGALNRPRRC